MVNLKLETSKEARRRAQASGNREKTKQKDLKKLFKREDVLAKYKIKKNN